MARLLVDEALPRSLVHHLRAAGYEADDIRDLGLRGQPDERLFEDAQQRSAILISSDLGFTNIFRFPPHSHRGLIILRLPTFLSVSKITEVVLRSLREVPLDSLAHTIVIVEPTRTRIRRFE